ncbi:lysine exporter LysO family protein [Geofilum rhodophaeum]|uniref:lysine exporter LysO family protein n=1 Tax=Geofilum rhodophaeum TaxID=1965019 RepID=UPI000B52504F|nr:lysine exporter LysO family protein [Geofilum rhodophaeum]
MKTSLLLLLSFVGGLALAAADGLPDFLLHEVWSQSVLWLLMFVVGVGVGSDKALVARMCGLSRGVFLVPVLVAAGSILGALLVSLFLKALQPAEAMAVGAGFGYYSLSAILIAGLHGEELAVVAMLANIVRELLTLVLAPWWVRWFGRLALVGAGGATAMDTTLPVVLKYSGQECTVVAVFSGLVLSLLVPVLVPLLLSFAF